MKPSLANAPRATPVAATSGANARQLDLGRVREVQPPAWPAMLLAPTIAVPTGTPMPAVKGGSSRRVWPAPPLTACPGPRPRQGKASHCTRHEGSQCSPRGSWAPGFRRDTTVGPRFLYRQYRPIAWIKPEGWAAQPWQLGGQPPPGGPSEGRRVPSVRLSEPGSQSP